jgi:hypothetical protein
MKNSRKQPKAKEPVKIRYKQLANGNQSIYFDIYRNGRRMYEFPKLYLVPERTSVDKEQNRQMLEKAIKIKAQRIDEMTNNENGFTNIGLKQKANFIEYIQALAENKRINGTRDVDDTYKGLIKHLIQYKGDKITFKHVT